MNPLVLALALQVCWQSPAENVDGTPLTDLETIELYAGPTSGSYTEMVGVPAQLPTEGDQCYQWNLDPGEWYIAAKAVNSAGEKSAFSNEIKKTQESNPTAPILFMDPTQAGADSRQVTLLIGETGKPVAQPIKGGQNIQIHLVAYGGTEATIRGQDGTWTVVDGNPVWNFTPQHAGLFFTRMRSCNATFTTCEEWSYSYDQGVMYYFKLQAPGGGTIE